MATPSRLIPPLPAEARTLSRGLAKGRVLRYRVDAASVAVTVLVVSVQLWAYWTAQPFWVLPLVLVGMRWGHLVEHNHAHLPIFRFALLDEALGWALAMSGGTPLELVRHQHVKVHHVHEHTDGDFTSPFHYTGARFPDRRTNFWWYLLTYAPRSIGRTVATFARQPRSRASRRFLLSMVVLVPLWVAMAWRDPASFALFYGLVWLIGYLGLAANNWGYHGDCDMQTVFTGANVNLSWMCRSAGFNIGYHSAHHWYPALHWSRLPRLHAGFMAEHVPLDRYRPLTPAQVGLDYAHLVPQPPATEGPCPA